MGSAPRARALRALIALIVLLFAAGSAQPDEADDPVPLPTSGSKPKLATLRPHSDGTPPPRGGGAIGDAASSNGVRQGEHPSARRRPHPIVLPSSGKEHTKLTLQKEGLDVLRGIKGPVAPVVVIGGARAKRRTKVADRPWHAFLVSSRPCRARKSWCRVRLENTTRASAVFTRHRCQNAYVAFVGIPATLIGHRTYRACFLQTQVPTCVSVCVPVSPTRPVPKR